jgi:16S rRNA (cytosine967-C5)-methyltransferase
VAAKKKSPHANISPARREAFAILLEIEKGSAHADDLLRSPRVSALSLQDRNLATTLVLGALRWQISLDAEIRKYLTKPNARLDAEILIALRLGTFQLQHLDRIPAHAAISDSVELAKSAGHKFAAGMVNAVLRKIASAPKPNLTPNLNLTPIELAAVTGHPAWLVERWANIYGLAAAQNICLHGQQQPELTIRVTDPHIDITEQGINLEPGALLTAARRVISGDVTATQHFANGVIRIQDEGSQLIAELAPHGAEILDACAAPGGKTLILAERNPAAQITACEISPPRLKAMRERFTQLAPTATIEVVQADATTLDTGKRYDSILVDAPCSGTGTLGRNPEIRHRLKPEDLARHQQRQAAILNGVLRVAAENGEVLYSTCSLEPEENQDVINAVLSANEGWRQVSLDERITSLSAKGILVESAAKKLQNCLTTNGSMMILPGSLGEGTRTDGFFAALLRRKH